MSQAPVGSVSAALWLGHRCSRPRHVGCSGSAHSEACVGDTSRFVMLVACWLQSSNPAFQHSSIPAGESAFAMTIRDSRLIHDSARKSPKSGESPSSQTTVRVLIHNHELLNQRRVDTRVTKCLWLLSCGSYRPYSFLAHTPPGTLRAWLRSCIHDSIACSSPVSFCLMRALGS